MQVAAEIAKNEAVQTDLGGQQNQGGSVQNNTTNSEII
jgi:hypothetical protein